MDGGLTARPPQGRESTVALVGTCEAADRAPPTRAAPTHPRLCAPALPRRPTRRRPSAVTWVRLSLGGASAAMATFLATRATSLACASASSASHSGTSRGQRATRSSTPSLGARALAGEAVTLTWFTCVIAWRPISLCAHQPSSLLPSCSALLATAKTADPFPHNRSPYRPGAAPKPIFVLHGTTAPLHGSGQFTATP